MTTRWMGAAPVPESTTASAPHHARSARQGSPWRRRAAVGVFGTAGAGVAMVAFAAAAWANAANPLPVSTGKISPAGNGAVRVDVSGMWNWGELSGSSKQSKCDGRYGVGWAVDWWGMSGSQQPNAINGLTGSTVTWAGKGSAPLNAGPVPLTPVGALQTVGGQFFHVTQNYNGFDADLCHAPDSLDKDGFPQGPWSAYAIYPDVNDVPAQLCVNFYDPHGQLGDPSDSAKDYNALTNDDNSIDKNNFNPATGVGYCFTPSFEHPLSIGVDKLNNADQQGDFHQTETATVAGQTVQFQVTVHNTSTEATTVIDSATDVFPGNGGLTVCNGSTSGDKTQDSGWSRTELGVQGSVTDSATCTFTLANYAPSAADKTNTVTVNVHEKGLVANTLSKNATSTVQPPVVKPTLASHIRLCSDNTLVGGGNLHVTGGSTPIADTGNLRATPVDPGSYTVDATAPAGYDFVSCTTRNPNYTGQSQLSATVPPNAVLNFYVAPVGQLKVTKTGPSTGVAGQDSSTPYTVTIENIGGTTLTKPVAFVDMLPAGEIFVSASGTDMSCQANAGNAREVDCSYNHDLAAGKSATVNITVHYASTAEGQTLTDCAGADPGRCRQRGRPVRRHQVAEARPGQEGPRDRRPGWARHLHDHRHQRG